MELSWRPLERLWSVYDERSETEKKSAAYCKQMDVSGVFKVNRELVLNLSCLVLSEQSQVDIVNLISKASFKAG